MTSAPLVARPGAARSHPLARLLVAGLLLASTSGTVAQAAPPPARAPVLQAWTPTQSMASGRDHATATLLEDGRVLVTGGYDIDTGRPLASTEIYSPLTDLWEEGPAMGSAHAVHTATLLRDGSVLVTGGGDLDGDGTSSAVERYRPGAGAWTPAGSMGWARALHTATLLLDGRVLVAGGRSAGTGTLAVAELFAA